MNDLDNIKKFKNDIDNIEVPTEVDFAIEKGLKKKEKRDKIKRLSIYFATAAAIIIVMINTPFVKTRIGNFYLQKTLKTDSRGMATLNSYSNLKNILRNSNVDITKGSLKTTVDYSVKNGSINGSADMTSTGSAKGSNVQNASHSSTNVQVDGVDEPDIIKNDGKFIYNLNYKNNKIMIVNAYPAQAMKLETSISLDGKIHASNMFLKDNFLVILGQYYESKDTSNDIKNHWYAGGKSKVLVYDIRNKENPKLVKSLMVSGNYSDSRLVGDEVYIISNQSINIDFKTGDEVDCAPTYTDSSLKEKNKKVDYKNIKYNPKDVAPNYINISSIDLSNVNTEARVTSVLGNGRNIYCNDKNLYTASQNSENKTIIYKFALSNGKAALQDKTEITGSVLNQFSMDEYNGYLRMAATQNANYVASDNTSSTVYVFDKNLKMVSKLSDIAKGEKIYSARFIGNRAYIVTFRQTDPLLALDLSDPKKPKITGKLEMPGFSTYLQSYDENHIIGFGENTHSSIENGYSVNINDGIKFAMFDITDMKNPKKMYDVNFGEEAEVNSNNTINVPTDNSNSSSITIPGDKTSNYDVDSNVIRYSSEVLHNHKALLFDKDKGIMALPIQVGDSGGLKCGIYVYKIDLRNGFKLAYKIESQKNESLTCRAVYIGDTLYTIFDSKIVAVDMNNFKSIGELKF